MQGVIGIGQGDIGAAIDQDVILLQTLSLLLLRFCIGAANFVLLIARLQRDAKMCTNVVPQIIVVNGSPLRCMPGRSQDQVVAAGDPGQ